LSLPLTGERTLPGIPEENYWFRRHVAAYRYAARFARGTVVDAGAGEGYGAGMLSGRARVMAVELDPLSLHHAAGRYPVPWFVRADLCSLPVAEHSVDLVVCLQVIEHLPCVDEFLGACRRILRPRGRVVLSTPNRATFPAGLNPFHVRELDAGELHAVLRSHFGHVEVLGIEHRAPLGLLDRALGEPVQRRLVRVPYREQPAWLRAVLRTVRSTDFRVTRDPGRSLDLVAVCRR
jgi:SAM-dependent methyltransferase